MKQLAGVMIWLVGWPLVLFLLTSMQARIHHPSRIVRGAVRGDRPMTDHEVRLLSEAERIIQAVQTPHTCLGIWGIILACLMAAVVLIVVSLL